MKTIITLLFSTLVLSAAAQKTTEPVIDATPSEKGKVFTVVEQMPEFPGGEEALMKFIGKNITYPDSAMNHDVQGRVVASFVVNEDGSISDVMVKKSVSWDLDREAIRVIRSLPKFKPGKQQGVPVKVNYILPIKFTLASEGPAKQKK